MKKNGSNGTKNHVNLNDNERAIMFLAADNGGKTTMEAMTDRFMRKARTMPKRWQYTTLKKPPTLASIIRWRASLMARHAIRKPCALGLLVRPVRGEYKITAAGRRALEAK